MKLGYIVRNSLEIIMKITIKTLQGKPTEFDVNENDTLLNLKGKISEVCKIDVANQKLIHYGKVLAEDNKRLADYGIKDKDFMVLMVTKVC
jgi:UV excision repair protein RAD23